MYAGLANLISNNMRLNGFSAKTLGSGVVVWLNREITEMEVQTVLENNFSGNYKVTKVAKNQVMIEEK